MNDSVCKAERGGAAAAALTYDNVAGEIPTSYLLKGERVRIPGMEGAGWRGGLLYL